MLEGSWKHKEKPKIGLVMAVCKCMYKTCIGWYHLMTLQLLLFVTLYLSKKYGLFWTNCTNYKFSKF